MTDIAKRFANNPIISPNDINPSIDGFDVIGVLNPGAFRFNNQIGLLIRVAEAPPVLDGFVQAPVIDRDNTVKTLKFPDDPQFLTLKESRLFSYNGKTYLTSISHLRLAWSEDEIHFKVEKEPLLMGNGQYESFGIEDCRVINIDDIFYLTYTAVSEKGFCVGLISTKDWYNFERWGIIFPPPNKNTAIFPCKIDDYYYALHRPSGVVIGGNYIWIAKSIDLKHWGNYECIAVTRPGKWDSCGIGPGAPPIKTEYGWLEIYHGTDKNNRYCLGALLLDLKNPFKVVARSEEPIMEPTMSYETEGFFGNVVFTNGCVYDGDILTVYYGASDEYICGAKFSIKEILTESLKVPTTNHR